MWTARTRDSTFTRKESRSHASKLNDNNETKKTIRSLTSITTRPIGWPSAVMSKKTLGLAILTVIFWDKWKLDATTRALPAGRGRQCFFLSLHTPTIYSYAPGSIPIPQVKTYLVLNFNSSFHANIYYLLPFCVRIIWIRIMFAHVWNYFF